ncbi:hypothetical protein V5O48_005860 [Marasmius crinis-equi]|uniref:Uncharacterized protein n=1 Tax=Marasmius crinis-equi TaxID=585013 RepID=A0ABR3FL44_9AGAR
MSRQSLLANEEPLEALYNHLNVYNISSTPLPETNMPPFIDVPVRRDSYMPTHIFALYPSGAPGSQPASVRPLLVPVDASSYHRGFRSDVIPPATPGSTSPVPRYTASAPYSVVTLPIIPLTVPHPPSVPLLLLYGMGLETQQQFLTPCLLPGHVVEEFPNAAEMAQVFATRVRASNEQGEPLDDDAIFMRRVRFNQGLWQNVLALGLRNQAVVEVIQTAWNITAEARRLRPRYKQVGARW